MNYLYEVCNFLTGEVFRTNSIRSAYRFADRSKRECKGECSVIGINKETNKRFFDYCSADFITGVWIDYLNGKTELFNTIIEYGNPDESLRIETKLPKGSRVQI